MNDPFANLENLQRRLGDVALEITRARFIHIRPPAAWRPALNAFRCGEQYVLCLELAGVDRDAIEIRAEPRRIAIRGTRPIAEPSCDDPPAVQVLALEIDNGSFERVLELPAEIDTERVTAEHRNGLLWVKLPFRSH